MIDNCQKILRLYLIVIFLILGWLSLIIFKLNFDLQIYFFDVGQGDSMLIKTPGQQYIVIDGGPDNTLIYKLGRYLPFYQRQIDLIILTHPDADHLVGLNEVLRRYQVENILVTGIVDAEPAYEEFWRLVKYHQTRVLLAGQTKNINLSADLNLAILYPNSSLVGQKVADSNDSSIVVRLDYPTGCVVLTGDASQSVEKQLLATDSKLSCGLLKLGHHGSKTSSSLDWLKAVNPALAIIQVGENKFGHPSPEVLNRLTQLNIPVLTTRSVGDIIVNLD
ncbi:MAG: MBL fold metallo-hydrolase [Patescibacteria group bacterium]|jgi:competence protein ComEC|nr:MBL fold metallo-hydrolase [Patescibacteria group bacterium]